MEATFRRHAALLQSARATPGQGSIALDGKTLRGSFDEFNDRAAAQVLSAFATDTALVLAHVRYRREVQRDPGGTGLVGRTRPRPGAIVTLDALHYQKKFVAATQASVALIVGVKDNQPNLHQRVQEVSATTVPIETVHSHDKGRNRDERRTVALFEPTSALADTNWHPHVAAVIRVERDVHTRNAKTGLLCHAAETAFHVSSTPVAASRAAEAIRAHRRIENTSHHSRDVTLGEDRSRTRTNPGVFARLRSFAFSILKANQTDTLSQDRCRAALSGVKELLRMLAVS